MTTPARLERELPGILDDLALGPTPEYLDGVFAQTARMRQRPAWTFPERWIPMAETASRPAFAPRLPWRAIGVALVIIALVAGVTAAYVGSHQTRLPAPFGPAANGLIAYTAIGDIYVGDPVTGASRLLVGGTHDDIAPSFSPDGTHVAFFRAIKDGVVDIFTVRADGADLRRITTEPIEAITWWQWTPDSQHLAVIHRQGANDRLDMIGMNGQVQRLAGDMSVTSLAFRPPLGQEILFRSPKAGQWGLFAMNADGSNIHPLVMSPNPLDVDETFNRATYSADGTRIFYQHGEPDGCCELWVMDADGSNQHRFLSVAANNNWEGVPVVSPDGRWVAFWQNVNDRPTQQISIMRADGTGAVIKTGPPLSGPASYVWAPDSSGLLMVANGSDGMAYLLDPAGGDWTSLGWTPGDVPDWQRLAP